MKKNLITDTFNTFLLKMQNYRENKKNSVFSRY